jgi:hypothetical protein
VGFLKGLFSGSASLDSGKFGSDSDPIRQMLFGSQPLAEQFKWMRLNGHLPQEATDGSPRG